MSIKKISAAALAAAVMATTTAITARVGMLDVSASSTLSEESFQVFESLCS